MKRSNLGILFLCSVFAATSCGGTFESDDDGGGGGGGGGGGSSTGSSSSTLQIRLTDAPFENWMVLEAMVTIDGMHLHEDANATSGFTTIMTDEFTTDLSKLANGVTEHLVSADIPAGTYNQARVSIKSASMRLVNGRTFSTANGSLVIGGHPAFGFKLTLTPPLVTRDGESTLALLDFDLSKSFRAQPVDDPLNATSVLLLPVMRCADVALCGELRGVVDQVDALLGSLEPVDKAFVYVMPPGETDISNRIATTGSEADGSYAFLGLKPGTYDLIASKGGKVRENGILVSKGQVTTVDLRIP